MIDFYKAKIICTKFKLFLQCWNLYQSWSSHFHLNFSNGEKNSFFRQHFLIAQSLSQIKKKKSAFLIYNMQVLNMSLHVVILLNLVHLKKADVIFWPLKKFEWLTSAEIYSFHWDISYLPSYTGFSIPRSIDMSLKLKSLFQIYTSQWRKKWDIYFPWFKNFCMY